jgi:hypothetical protein
MKAFLSIHRILFYLLVFISSSTMQSLHYYIRSELTIWGSLPLLWHCIFLFRNLLLCWWPWNTHAHQMIHEARFLVLHLEFSYGYLYYFLFKSQLPTISPLLHHLTICFELPHSLLSDLKKGWICPSWLWFSNY